MFIRTDAAQIRQYLEGGGYASTREIEVYGMCIRDGVSLSRCAVAMGLSFETVRDYLRRLRIRVRNPGIARMRRARRPLIELVA